MDTISQISAPNYVLFQDIFAKLRFVGLEKINRFPIEEDAKCP